MVTLDLRREAAAHRVDLRGQPSLHPVERELVESTWRGRMLNEYASARVFAGLLPQLMRAGYGAPRLEAAARMAADELRHAQQCAGALAAVGAEPVGELPGLDDIPAHPDAVDAQEVVLRNVLSICCLSETVAVALIEAERRALGDSPLGEVLRRILGDEVQHARFGWTLLGEASLDADRRSRLSAYLSVALAHLERHELAHLSPVSAPPAAAALGACDGAAARRLFYETVETIIVPRLEQLGLAADRAWRTRPRRADDAGTTARPAPGAPGSSSAPAAPGRRPTSDRPRSRAAV